MGSRPEGRAEQKALSAADEDRVISARGPRGQLRQARQRAHDLETAFVQASVCQADFLRVDDTDPRACRSGMPLVRRSVPHISPVARPFDRTGPSLARTTEQSKGEPPLSMPPTQFWCCRFSLQGICRGHGGHRRGPVRDVQPPQEVGHMLLCRCGGDAERSRDLFVCRALRDEHDDFTLTGRQR